MFAGCRLQIAFVAHTRFANKTARITAETGETRMITALHIQLFSAQVTLSKRRKNFVLYDPKSSQTKLLLQSHSCINFIYYFRTCLDPLRPSSGTLFIFTLYFSDAFPYVGHYWLSCYTRSLLVVPFPIWFLYRSLPTTWPCILRLTLSWINQEQGSEFVLHTRKCRMSPWFCFILEKIGSLMLGGVMYNCG
jgi:hypothetical protein